jgi:hypothetical protein
MYDELIKALRDPAHSLDCEFCDSRYCHPDRKGYGKCIIVKAADAIAELSRENESLAKSVNEASEILRKRWIPVTERLPQTNADKLRAMSDEELAEFFTPFYYDGPKFYCPAQADVGEGECAAKSDCRQCWLNWLRQEVQDG